MNPISSFVKNLMDSGPAAADRTGTDTLERLGFRAALLDPTTFSIYILGPDALATPGAGYVTGFERNGFFYTRSAAARAAAEWV